jgi:tRNA A37 threonylcarbamoyladenosine biosynthesis protein TsaE
MVVEWAEKIRDILPLQQAQGREKTIDINFKFIDDITREIEIEGTNDFNN